MSADLGNLCVSIFLIQISIPAALTKDKKRVHGQEVAVHLAWQSTLYVTNFPESADDAFIRNMFEKVSNIQRLQVCRCALLSNICTSLQYGVIFDVRWPSKKFKSTRRFCYVQYTTPVSPGSVMSPPIKPYKGTSLQQIRPLYCTASNWRVNPLPSTFLTRNVGRIEQMPMPTRGSCT